MCFALFIAAGSFFSIRERVATILPEPFTTGPMRALPILLLFGAMFYWLWRVRRRRGSLAAPARSSLSLAEGGHGATHLFAVHADGRAHHEIAGGNPLMAKPLNAIRTSSRGPGVSGTSPPMRAGLSASAARSSDTVTVAFFGTW